MRRDRVSKSRTDLIILSNLPKFVLIKTSFAHFSWQDMQDDIQEDTAGIIAVNEALAAFGTGSPRRAVEIKQLSGGLTNDNILITLPASDESQTGRKIVLRRFCLKTGRHLGYDRDQEYHNSCKAATLKSVGAPVIGYVRCTEKHGGALALEYVEGKTLDEGSIKELCNSEDGLYLLVDALKRLHSIPVSFKNAFDPFKARIYYEEQVRIMTGRDVPWSGYSDLVDKLALLERILRKDQEDLVDCHNDLLSANFILSNDREKLIIIDWELAGQAEASWELGNFISENGLDGDEKTISSLVSLYWSHLPEGAEMQEKIKRAKMYSLVSKITWAAWGAVLHNLDKSNTFDYEDWCMQKLQKAEEAFRDEDSIRRLLRW